jgi:hypothetical protein
MITQKRLKKEPLISQKEFGFHENRFRSCAKKKAAPMNSLFHFLTEGIID